MNKKTWNKPQLVVLCRGNIQENILGNCKAASPGILGGPVNTNFACFAISGSCALCSAPSSS